VHDQSRQSVTPNLDILKWIRADIFHAPSELPEGAYNVSFEGRTMKVKKIAGNWEAGEV